MGTITQEHYNDAIDILEYNQIQELIWLLQEYIDEIDASKYEDN